VRELGHEIAHFYDLVKEKTILWTTKQLPLRAKSTWNKSTSLISELGNQYLEKIRDTKLLKSKKDGISEFFKNINEVKKGQGSIEEPWPEGFQDEEEEVK